MAGLCRLCATLRKLDALVSIKDESHEICEKLRKCCQLDIKMQDPLPKSICQECIENLNNSHKFYTKVTQAQEALQALYPTTSSTQQQSENEIDTAETSLVETLTALKEKTKKRNRTPMEQEAEKLSNENEKLKKPEIPLKQIKLENCPRTNDSVKEIPDDRSTTESKKSRVNYIEEVYHMLEMTKEEAMLESSYEILETIDENVEDLTEEGSEKCFSYQEVCEQPEQFVEEHHVLEDNSKNAIAALHENALQANYIDRKPENIVPERGFSIEYEYVENYEEEDDDDETVFNLDMQQSVSDAQQINHQQLNSWKLYKYLCFICDESFSNFIELYNHIGQEHKKTQIDKLHYKCYDCQKVIPRYNFFLNHIRSKHHPNLRLKCEVCDLSCQNFEELSFHRNGNCEEAINYAHIIPCNQCFKSFHNAYDLQNHYKTQHSSTKGKLKYECSVCNKEFQYKSCLKVHAQVHSDKKRFACSFCDSTFAHKNSLELHLYVHVDEKTYKCNICNKSFKTFLTLDQHQILHKEDKPFKCEFCDKNFRKKIQKIAHERTHTGEMPFACGLCDKRFRFLSALNAHTKFHTGAKPYSCEYCDKMFADSSNRNKHVKRKHGNGEREVKNKEK